MFHLQLGFCLYITVIIIHSFIYKELKNFCVTLFFPHKDSYHKLDLGTWFCMSWKGSKLSTFFSDCPNLAISDKQSSVSSLIIMPNEESVEPRMINDYFITVLSASIDLEFIFSRAAQLELLLHNFKNYTCRYWEPRSYMEGGGTL